MAGFELYLIRHGLAGERGPECKLTDQGSSVRATIKFNE